jgi:peptidoglycan/LPS O-acetylase OafA/YrhL
LNAFAATDPSVLADMFSSATAPAYLVIALLCALAWTKFLSRLTSPKPLNERFATIDGLRGYLALMVFVHHACIWYFVGQGGGWAQPPSNLYTHLGQSSVILFFMITGFLFFHRILSSGPSGPDWLQLLVSRVLRLTPLYWCAIAGMVLWIFVSTGFTLYQSLWTFVKSVGHWMLFTMTYAPALNGAKWPDQVLAGVVWSLHYEWFFYGCLPLAALLAGRRPPAWALGVSAIAAFYFWQWEPRGIHLFAFGCGMGSAMLIHRFGCKIQPSQRWPDLLVVVLLIALVTFFADGTGYVQVAILGVVFWAIANGASLFGVLLLRVSRMLGDMAYGIYLLHGLLLFSALGFRFSGTSLSPEAHWALVMALIPPLVTLCWIAHRWVELPAMALVPTVVRRLRRRDTT